MLSNTAAIMNTPDERFVDTNKHYIIINNKKMSEKQYSELENIANNLVANQKSGNIKGYVIPGKSIINIPIRYDNFLQTGVEMGESIKTSITDVNTLKKKDLISGKMPENPSEVVVDKLAFKTLIDEGLANQAGYFKASDFVGMDLKVGENVTLKITGIVDKSSPSILSLIHI